MKLDSKTLQTRYSPKLQGKPLAQDRQLGVIRFSPDGKVLAGGDFEGGVCRWDASGETLAPLPALAGHHGWVQALAFHPDGKRLFTADSWGKVCAWPFAEKAPRPVWQREAAHDGWIRKLAVSPDGQTVATCGADGKVRLWSADRGEMRREWSAGLDVLSLAFHPDGKSLVFGDLRGTIHQHDTATGKPVRTFQAKEMYRLDRIQDVGGVRCLAFDAAGTTLVAGGCIPTSGGFVQGTALLVFYEAATGKVIQSQKIGANNDGYVFDAHWHPQGFVMAVTSGQPGQGKLVFHRPGDAQPFFQMANMANCHAIAVHPSGKRLVVQGTNANSAGNGRPKTKDKTYPGNSSPLFTWVFPAA